jgi:hypothetical protein
VAKAIEIEGATVGNDKALIAQYLGIVILVQISEASGDIYHAKKRRRLSSLQDRFAKRTIYRRQN